MEPEAALAAARQAAAEARAAGEYPPARPGAGPPAPPEFSPAQLTEWALIEPDLREIRSTRPYGAPITALKRGLLRLLGQYHGQILSQHIRFNLHLLGQVRALEQRVAELERRLDEPDR